MMDSITCFLDGLLRGELAVVLFLATVALMKYIMAKRDAEK